jgi:rubrerythrin
MFDRTVLRERVEQMHEKVVSAAAEYTRLAGASQDQQAKDQFERMAREEHRHVELTQRLLEILDG